jgi:PAS domain S-box-containing protein
MAPGGAPSFPARLVVVGRPDGDGIPHELLWLVHDLSDRERFELALRASEEAFRALAENGPDPIIRLDRDLRVEYANAATERLTGRRSGELVGARAAELFLSGEGADALADASARALAGAEEMVEVSFDAPAGRRWLELRIVPERGEGHVKRLLVVGRDVTARREAAQDLRESGDLKNTMLATVSHELRTPLTAIAAAADALAGAGAANSGEMIELISGETTRLERMVGNLLDLSRLQGRAVTPRLEVYPVETLVGSALAAMGGSLDDVEVAIDLSDDAAFVMVDPMMVERILVNLLDNAMTHGAPPLRLLCRAEGGRVELSVADSGPGVPDGDEGRIFLPFVHGGSPGSAGIGLALALALAETQGALLALRRELGAGACFVLTLTPAEFEPDAEDAGMPREEEGG